MWQALIGYGPWDGTAVLHGFLGSALLLNYGALLEALWAGRHLGRLRMLTAAQVVLTTVTVGAGMHLVTGYRAPGGAKAFFLAHRPELHRFAFEFKEYLAPMTVPLVVTAAYLVWSAAAYLPEARRAVLACVLLAFAFTVTAFGLGALMARTMGVH